MPETCSTRGCTNPVKIRKRVLCKDCYPRWWKFGDASAGRHAARSLPDEIWRPIPQWEEYYEASSRGRIRRAAPGSGTVVGYVLRPGNVQGYQQVMLSRESRAVPRRVHRLVALAFLGPSPPRRDHVNHIDSDRANNSVANLEWVSPAENNAHAVARRPSRPPHDSAAWRTLRADWLAAGVLQQEVAHALGVAPATLSNWMHGKPAPPDIAKRVARAIPTAVRERRASLRAQLRALG